MVYVWHAAIHATTVAESLVASGFDIRAQIVWSKNRFALGRGDYHWQHEPCWYAVRKKATSHWQGARDQSTLWSIAPIGTEDAATAHGAQKPVEAMRRPIVNNSAREPAYAAQPYSQLQAVRGLSEALARYRHARRVRAFQLHLIESGASICNRNRIMTGVRFLFRVTLRRHDLAAEVYHIKEPQKLPPTMSPDEAKRLLAMATNLKVHVMLALGYGCGLRAGEIVRLRAGDIDSAQMIIRIVQLKGRKDRHVMLPQEALDLLGSGGRYARHDRRERATTRALAVPWAPEGSASDDAAAEPSVPRDNSRGRHQKARDLHSLRHSFATICSNAAPTFA